MAAYNSDVRRLAFVPPVLFCLACSLLASASAPQTTAPVPVKKQAVAEDQLRSAAQNRYQKAIRDKAPLTASPADGESFVNEFIGSAVDDNTASDETLTSSHNPAQLPK